MYKRDGGGKLGSVTTHCCHESAHGDGSADTSRDRVLLAQRGLAVFAHSWGGRGVHIKSMQPGWQCALVFRTAEQLHGSIMPDAEGMHGFALDCYDMMRVVTYPLSTVEGLLSRLACEPAKWSSILAASQPWIQARARSCDMT